MRGLRTQAAIELESRLFFIREARRRGNSKWSRDFWTITEQTLIRQYNNKLLLEGVLVNA
jgi:hypothetical protein